MYYGAYTNAITNNGSLIISYAFGQQFLAGPISGTGSLTVNVPEQNLFQLTGTNTYTGATIVTATNVLYVSTNGLLPAGSELIMYGGAAVDFSGTTPAGGLVRLAQAAPLDAIADPVNGSPGLVGPPGTNQFAFGPGPINVTFDGIDTPLAAFGSAPSFFNGTAFNVTNTSGTPLGAGTYPLYGGGGILYGTVSPYVAVFGAGLEPGMGGRVQIDSGTEVDLVVAPAPVFTNLTASQSIVYGTPNITLSGTVTAPGPIYPANGEQIDVLIAGIDHTATINDNTGDFSLNFVTTNIPVSLPWTIYYNYSGDNQLSAVVNSNKTLTVTPAPLTITASAQSKTYGQAVASGPGNTHFTTNGLLNGQKIGSVTLTISGSGGTTNAGVSGSPYTITPSAATGGTFNPGNYSITYVTNLLTVNPAPLSLAASNATRFYGATNPVFGVIYNGLTNGQSRATSDIGGNPSLMTAAATNSPIGAYVITNTIGTLTSTNYSFAGFTNGTLTINPLPVVLTGARAYDGSNDKAARPSSSSAIISMAQI